MAGHVVAEAELAGLDPIVRAWLGEVAAALAGPRRWRAGVLAELADGLLEATEKHRRAGTDTDTAGIVGRAVLREFGDPRVVAQGFLAERAAGLAQRVGRNVLMSGPVAGAAWLITLAASAVPMLHGQLAGPWWALTLLGALLAGAIPLAARVSAPVRWSWTPSTLSPRAVVRWAQLATLGVVAADGLMLVMFAAWTTTSPPPDAFGPLAAVGVIVSVIRMPALGWAGWVCHRVRARVQES